MYLGQRVNIYIDATNVTSSRTVGIESDVELSPAAMWSIAETIRAEQDYQSEPVPLIQISASPFLEPVPEPS